MRDEGIVIEPAAPGQHDIVLTGITNGTSMPIHNSGKLALRFVRPGFPDLVLKPGKSAFIDKGVAYRLACNDCGLSDGSHETWCPLWQPYVAEL